MKTGKNFSDLEMIYEKYLVKRSIFLNLLLGLFILFTDLGAQEATLAEEVEGMWKAGVARTIITPPEYMWMAGYAARDKPADGKIHDLWAKALALEDSKGNRALLITTDVIGFSRDLSQSICDHLREKFHLNRKDIILSSSHTHSGPVMNYNLFGIYPPFDERQNIKIDAYRRFISDQIEIVAGRAINSLAPAKLSSGVGIARFAVNRRESGWEGDILYSPEVKGPSDHAVQVIVVNNPEGQLLTVVFGYSCHATSLSGNQWSGDYPGFAQDEIESMYPGITAMFFGGFGADQNPFPRGGILEAEQYGKELALAVEKVIKAPKRDLSASINSTYSEIELDISAPPDNRELEQLMENGADWEKRWAKKIQEKIADGEELPSSYPWYPIQCWQLGSQTLVILGGEVVVDYAFRFRKLFGNELMVMGYANDVMAYIPSERVLEEGGYEGKTSMWVYGHRGIWVPGIEDKIVDEVVRQINRLSGVAGE